MAAALPEGGAAASFVYPFTGHSPLRKQLRAGWKNGKNREWKLQINFSLCIFAGNIFYYEN